MTKKYQLNFSGICLHFVVFNDNYCFFSCHLVLFYIENKTKMSYKKGPRNENFEQH